MTRLPDTRFRARHSLPGAAFPALHNEARLGAAGAPPARSPWAGRQPCRRAAASSTQGTPYKAPSSPEASGFTETAKKPPERTTRAASQRRAAGGLRAGSAEPGGRTCWLSRSLRSSPSAAIVRPHKRGPQRLFQRHGFRPTPPAATAQPGSQQLPLTAGALSAARDATDRLRSPGPPPRLPYPRPSGPV